MLHHLLLEELDRESKSTRKILQLVPQDKNDWKPHKKSMTLGRLATHVAELSHWINRCLEMDEFDMAANPYVSHVCNSNEELIALFEDKLSKAKHALQNVSDEELEKEWIFRRGEHILSQSSRYNTIRSWMLNHQVHHRGQLSVYLRLLDVPVPGMYGPSADDILARQAAAAQKA